MQKRALVIDAVLLAVYLIVANPAITGVSVHEWLGIAAFAVFFAHVAQHIDRMGAVLLGIRAGVSAPRLGNVVLNVFSLIVLTVCIVSGVLVSGAVLPTFGLYSMGYYFWDPLHALSAKVLLALLLVHVLIHGKHFACLFAKGKGIEHGAER